jgi:hypothetical protein
LSKRLKRILLFFGGITLFFLIGYLSSQRVVYEHETRLDSNEIKFAHITDTHFIDNYNEKRFVKIIDSINQEEVDVVLFTGDLFQVEDVSSTLEEKITTLLSSLECTHKLAVLGNHDLRSDVKRDTVIRILEDSGFTVLRNEDIELTIHDTVYHFIGLDDYSRGVSHYDEILKTVDDYEHNYVLSHEPDTFDQVYPLNVSAMFSGHSHGGQVRLPIIGDIVMVYGARNYPDHYYVKEGTELFTSFGLGDAGIQFRFCNPRYVNFYTNS